jgi:hypothetical protein
MANKNKNPPPASGWQRVLESSFALLLDLVQRMQHDRRPATGMVVVMPISIMANGAEHCPGLIPDYPDRCQTFWSPGNV